MNLLPACHIFLVIFIHASVTKMEPPVIFLVSPTTNYDSIVTMHVGSWCLATYILCLIAKGGTGFKLFVT